MARPVSEREVTLSISIWVMTKKEGQLPEHRDCLGGHKWHLDSSYWLKEATVNGVVDDVAIKGKYSHGEGKRGWGAKYAHIVELLCRLKMCYADRFGFTRLHIGGGAGHSLRDAQPRKDKNGKEKEPVYVDWLDEFFGAVWESGHDLGGEISDCQSEDCPKWYCTTNLLFQVLPRKCEFRIDPVRITNRNSSIKIEIYLDGEKQVWQRMQKCMVEAIADDIRNSFVRSKSKKEEIKFPIPDRKCEFRLSEVEDRRTSSKSEGKTSKESTTSEESTEEIDLRDDPAKASTLYSYLAWLQRKFQKLEFRVFGSSEAPPSVDLDQVYVALKGERTHRRHSADELTLGEAFCRERMLVILGDPGMGKTTLAHWLVLRLATALKNGDKEVKVLKHQIDPAAEITDEKVSLGPARIPILIRVAEFVKYRKKNGGSLAEFLGQQTWFAEKNNIWSRKQKQTRRRHPSSRVKSNSQRFVAEQQSCCDFGWVRRNN